MGRAHYVCREKVSSAAAHLKEAVQGAGQHGAGLQTALQQLAEALQPEEHLPALLKGKQTCSCPCPPSKAQAARQLMTPVCLCMLRYAKCLAWHDAQGTPQADTPTVQRIQCNQTKLF